MKRFASRLAGRALVLAAFCTAAGAALAAPEPPRAGLVGQVISVSQVGAVTVTHRGGAPIRAEPYQPLYNGDTVQVVTPNGAATLEFAGANGGDVQVTRSRSPYHVTAASSPVQAASWDRFVQKWGYVLQPPAGVHIESTTDRGALPTAATGLAASRYLPLIKQQVSVSGARAFPVVWQGEPAPVVLKDGTGAVVAQTGAGQPGYALVKCPHSLSAGDYRLEIGQTPKGPLVIQVAVVDAADKPTSTHEEDALRAADALAGAPSGRLQALADLQNLADKSYLANAVMKAVQSGE